MIKIDTSKLQRFAMRMQNARDRGEKPLDKASALLANRVRTNAIKLIAGAPRGGAEYVRYFPGGGTRTGKASAPGEPPATDLGGLVRSIRTRKVAEGSYEVVAATPYAIPLEFGTERMGARPFMTPAFVEAIPEFKDVLWKAWEETKKELQAQKDK